MSESKLIELGYYDPSAKIRLSAYADTIPSAAHSGAIRSVPISRRSCVEKSAVSSAMSSTNTTTPAVRATPWQNYMVFPSRLLE